MKKLILGGMAVAVLALPAVSSASVERYQEQTGTLTTHVAYGDQSSVHTYKGVDHPVQRHVHRQRRFLALGHATYPDGYSWDVASGGNGSDVVGRTFKVTNDLTTKNTTNYKNHGEFVSQSDDKNDAAHSCVGMPINSSK